jgi:hypothetical protein
VQLKWNQSANATGCLDGVAPFLKDVFGLFSPDALVKTEKHRRKRGSARPPFVSPFVFSLSSD